MIALVLPGMAHRFQASCSSPSQSSEPWREHSKKFEVPSISNVVPVGARLVEIEKVGTDNGRLARARPSPYFARWFGPPVDLEEKSVPSTCEMSGAEFDLKNGMLIAPAPTIFEIKTWTPGRITAIREHPCGTALLTVDVKTEDVTIASTPHADIPFCSKEAADIWRLADGFKITWNLYRDRYHKARELVYEPAKKMFPIRVPAN